VKIIYIGNFGQRHCTEMHLASTLEDLGHEVIRLQEDAISKDDLLYKLSNESLDLFLFTRTWGNTVTLEHLSKLRDRGIPSISYHLDLYIGLKRENGLDSDPFWRTDYVFTPDGSPEAAAVFKSKGINHFYMKPGIYKLEAYMAKQNIDPLHDVIFVGGGTPEGEAYQYGHEEWPYRGKLLKWLRDTYGGRYSKYGYPELTVRNEELNQLYANSKVVVGDSLCIDFMKSYYWSDRVYETLGRGGFLIHPFIRGMNEEFKDGIHLRYYEYGNFKQLKYLIDYYLKDDSEREKIRTRGHEFVKKNATYHNRLTRMLEIINAKN
jgi:hypothetical protein